MRRMWVESERSDFRREEWTGGSVLEDISLAGVVEWDLFSEFEIDRVLFAV